MSVQNNVMNVLLKTKRYLKPMLVSVLKTLIKTLFDSDPLTPNEISFRYLYFLRDVRGRH